MQKDLISRQMAVETIMGQPPEPHYPSWYAAQIEGLPPAQPTVQSDWDEMLIICDCCGHAIHVKKLH